MKRCQTYETPLYQRPRAEGVCVHKTPIAGGPFGSSSHRPHSVVLSDTVNLSRTIAANKSQLRKMQRKFNQDPSRKRAPPRGTAYCVRGNVRREGGRWSVAPVPAWYLIFNGKMMAKRTSSSCCTRRWPPPGVSASGAITRALPVRPGQFEPSISGLYCY